MNIRKCNKCGAMIEVIKDCTCDNCGIRCCGEPMATASINPEVANVEKHTPIYEIIGEYIAVTVNHPNEPNHFISHLGLKSERINAKKSFKAGEPVKAIFPYIKGSTIYTICNLHGVCEIVVE